MSFADKFPLLFWDVDIKVVDNEQHQRFIIERILEDGTQASVNQLLATYSAELIIEVIKKTRKISKRTALFWQAYFNIQEPIYCLNREYQSPLSALWE